MRLFIRVEGRKNGLALKKTILFLKRKFGYPHIDRELYDADLIAIGDEEHMDIDGHSLEFDTPDYEEAEAENAEEVERCFEILAGIEKEVLKKNAIKAFYID